MNTLAWLVGAIARRWARVMLRWAETRYERHAVRLFVYSNVLASADEPSLVGRDGTRRGHRPLSAGDPEMARDFWQRCVVEWTLSELARRRGIVLDSWKPARPAREQDCRQFSRTAGRR